MKKSFFLIHVVLSLAISVMLFFTTLFYLGSYEQLAEKLKNEFWSFFFSRLIFNAVFFIVALGVLAIINKLFKNQIDKKLRRRVLSAELLLFFALSITFIFILYL